MQKAKLTEAQLKAFFDAGYTQENAIDVILGVSLATLCNYVNNIAETQSILNYRHLHNQANNKSAVKNDRTFLFLHKLFNLI